MILNQIALNPIVHYQQFANHIQQQLPTLMIPVFELDPSSPARAVEEQPLDHEKSSEYLELHTLIDYQPWLKQLYRLWQQDLQRQFDSFSIQQNPPQPDHWHPESTARVINTLALAFSGCLMHKFKQDPIRVVERITQQWRDTWLNYRQDLTHQSLPIATLQALDNTANFFQQYWLESWLHIAELQSTLPTNPLENTPSNH